MNRRTFLALTALTTRASSFAQDTRTASSADVNLKPILLPKPEMDGGKSVLAALKERKTIRNISGQELSSQMLSNLLWAAWGVNREADSTGRIGRTAASAMNSQEIDLYVVLAEGAYLYEAIPHRLAPVVAGDHRAKVGPQGRGSSGIMPPVKLVFVADLAKYGDKKPPEPETQQSFYYVATGLISGNAYLFAASRGLAAWFHTCDQAGMATLLKLRREQRVLYAQTMGYPA